MITCSAHKEKKREFEIPNALRNIYKEMEVSPVAILENYGLYLVYGKMHKYETESKYFEKKYDCSFEKFKSNVESMQNEEKFEWEDDLMDWRFAVENLNYWQKRSQEIQG